MKKILLFFFLFGLSLLALPSGTKAQSAVPGTVQCMTSTGQWGPCYSIFQPQAVQLATASTATAAKTLVVTFGSNTAQGDTLLASCGGSNYATSNWTATVTDSQSNTFTQDDLEPESTTEFAAVFRAQNTIGGSKDQVTLTIAGSSSANESLACTIYDIPGVLAPKSALDQSNQGASTGSTSVSAGSVTPTGSFELAITAIAAGATSTPTITPGSFWHPDSGTAPNCNVAPASGGLTFCSESQPVTTTPGAMTGNATLSVSNAYAAVVVTYGVFKPAARVSGEGVAGTPAGGVVSVQGETGMTPLSTSDNITELDGTALSAPSNYGTAPTGEVIGVNSYVTNSPSVTQSGVWTVGLSSGSNTVGAVNQGTSPWVDNLTQVDGTALGAPSTYGTSPGAVNVIGVNADVTNTIAGNITQVDGTALGAPSAYGTSPGAVNVPGVNAYVTNTPTVEPGNTQNTTPWLANPVPSTSSTYSFAAAPYTNNAVTTAVNPKSTAGNVYGADIENPNTSVCWLQFYNSTAPTLGTSVIFAIPVLASGGIAKNLPFPVNFSTAISIAATTTATGSTACSTGMGVTLYYQ